MRQKNAHFDVHPDIIFYPSRRENPSTFAENIFFLFSLYVVGYWSDFVSNKQISRKSIDRDRIFAHLIHLKDWTWN